MSSPPSTDLGFLSLFPGGGSDSDEETEAPRELSSKELRIQRAIDEGKRTYGRGQAETPAGVSASGPSPAVPFEVARADLFALLWACARQWFANDEVIKAKAPEEKQLQRYRGASAFSPPARTSS